MPGLGWAVAGPGWLGWAGLAGLGWAGHNIKETMMNGTLLCPAPAQHRDTQSCSVVNWNLEFRIPKLRLILIIGENRGTSSSTRSLIA